MLPSPVIWSKECTMRRWEEIHRRRTDLGTEILAMTFALYFLGVMHLVVQALLPVIRLLF